MQARAPCPSPLTHSSRTISPLRRASFFVGRILITEGLAVPFVCGATGWVPSCAGLRVSDGAGFAERKRRDDS
jgi:hypothetical protein